MLCPCTPAAPHVRQVRDLKILIAINADIYVRNYLRTNALDELLKNHDCDFIANSSISLRQEVEQIPTFRGFYANDARTDGAHKLLFNLMMWKNRKKSRTFLFRWMRNSQWPSFSAEDTWYSRTNKFLRWALSASLNPNGLLIPILANPLFFGSATWLLKRTLLINPTIEQLVRGQRYDLIVFPSAAYDSPTIDLIRLGKKLNYPTLCLIDNWDNLTSKTVFWIRPDFLGVWGEQSAQHAIEIHSFRPERVFAIGTPRFDVYLSQRPTTRNPSPYPFPYVLFAGSAMPFDEIRALQEIESAITGPPGFDTALKIVYRPHPWRQKHNSETTFDNSKLERTVIDNQISRARDSESDGDSAGSFQPDLDYYPGLLRNALVVIGPLTTMLFEAALCMRPVIALSYNDGLNAHTSRRYFKHFDGTEKIPGFTFCNQMGDLSPLLSEQLTAPPIGEEESLAATSFFLQRPVGSYGAELLKLVSTAGNRQ